MSPQFHDLAKLQTPTHSSRITRHLVSVNILLLRFFQDVAGIFTDARGSMVLP